RKIVFTALLLSFVGINSFAQSVNAPLNEDYYHLIERFEIQNRQFAPAFHATVKPYTRQSIVQLLDSVDQSTLSKQDRFNWRYLNNDNWDYASEHDSSFLREKAILKAL